MIPPDELEILWKTQPLDNAVKGEEMRMAVLQKITSFDRMIRMRNRIESVAALAVAAFFLYAGTQRNGLQRLGSLIVAAGALWIIYYVRRHGMDHGEPAPDQPVESFRQALALKYEHQIRLLRNVKFWYLLPMYIGLLTTTAGLLNDQSQTRRLMWTDAIGPVIYTLIFAGVWWLNEVFAVHKLQRSRTQILSGMDNHSQC